MTNPISSTSLRSQLGHAWDTLIRAQATDANPAILEVAKAQIKELESQITGASSLSDAERVSLGNSLEAVTSTLGKLAGDNGPSVSQIRFLAGYAIVGTLVAIAVAIPALVSDKVNPVVVVALGALGAFLSYIQSFCQYVGEQKFIRSWFLYYILYPLKGAGLALIIYLLLDTKIVELKIGGGGDANGTLTAAVYYFIAALSGMFSTNAIQMLSDVFAIVFRSVEGKDSLKKKES
jgi:hypothetical protein